MNTSVDISLFFVLMHRGPDLHGDEDDDDDEDEAAGQGGAGGASTSAGQGSRRNARLPPHMKEKTAVQVNCFFCCCSCFNRSLLCLLSEDLVTYSVVFA